MLFKAVDAFWVDNNAKTVNVNYIHVIAPLYNCFPTAVLYIRRSNMYNIGINFYFSP